MLKTAMCFPVYPEKTQYGLFPLAGSILVKNDLCSKKIHDYFSAKKHIFFTFGSLF
jgi:hypothetical protein